MNNNITRQCAVPFPLSSVEKKKKKKKGMWKAKQKQVKSISSAGPLQQVFCATADLCLAHIFGWSVSLHVPSILKPFYFFVHCIKENKTCSTGRRDQLKKKKNYSNSRTVLYHKALLVLHRTDIFPPVYHIICHTSCALCRLPWATRLAKMLLHWEAVICNSLTNIQTRADPGKESHGWIKLAHFVSKSMEHLKTKSLISGFYLDLFHLLDQTCFEVVCLFNFTVLFICVLPALITFFSRTWWHCICNKYLGTEKLNTLSTAW